MKRKKGFLTLLMVGVVVLFLSLSGTSFGGPGPNPGTLPGYKVIGPTLKGVIIAGWLESEDSLGTVEAFLRVDDRLYTGIIVKDNPENDFLGTVPFHITTWTLPARLTTDYNMGEDAEAVIFDEKDVSNLVIIPYVALDVKTCVDDRLSYKHVLHCEVKISFLVPK